MLHRILRGLVEQQLVPSFDCRIYRDGKSVFQERFPEEVPEFVYDTASLTKPLVTFPLVRRVLGKLDTPIAELLPEAGIQASFRDLLTHKAGLKPWLPLYLYEEDDVEAIRRKGVNPDADPRQPVYSCLGYILVSRAMERMVKKPFSEMVRDFLFPFPACEINPGPRPDVAPTEHGNRYELELARNFVENPDESLFRLGRDIHGEPHDLNAFHAGGIFGNAGLFATAGGVMALFMSLLGMETAFIPLMRKAGYRYHLGFTGTGIAVSEDRRTAVVFLSNRVHPQVKDIDFSAVRHRIFRTAMEMAS